MNLKFGLCFTLQENAGPGACALNGFQTFLSCGKRDTLSAVDAEGLDDRLEAEGMAAIKICHAADHAHRYLSNEQTKPLGLNLAMNTMNTFFSTKLTSLHAFVFSQLC